ncbi:hypothetical protein CPC16_005477, partial [Podila verticillata]
MNVNVEIAWTQWDLTDLGVSVWSLYHHVVPGVHSDMVSVAAGTIEDEIPRLEFYPANYSRVFAVELRIAIAWSDIEAQAFSDGITGEATIVKANSFWGAARFRAC